MRRRDATTSLFHNQLERRRSACVALCLSLATHAVLLALLGTARLPPATAVDPIRVSLLAGGGGAPAGLRPAPMADTATSLAVESAPTHVRPRTAPKHPHPQPAPAVVAVSATGVDRDAPLAVPADAGAGDAAASASGAGGGAGRGGGTGGGDGVDQRPACVYCPQPHYPLIARARGWQGTVDIGLLVQADGSVDAASLRRSSGYDALDAAAIAVARQSRFQPPAANGLSVPLHGRIEYRFELTSAH